MQILKQISAIVLGMIFLISSSGFIMYKSHCSCSGDEQVSIFVQNEICNPHGNESCCEETATSCCSAKETKQCESYTSDCDCDKPEVTYIKLNNTVVKEEVRFTKLDPVKLVVVFTSVRLNLWKTEESLNFSTPYIDPPSIHNSSQEFLIKIQQLKIPHIV